MQELNQYLQELLSSFGSALHLEPNKQPYVATSNGKSELTNTPLPGAKINTLIFSLIPNDVKQQLPTNSQVEFIHPHNLGDFSFLVKKSPAGFIVTVTPCEKISIPEPISEPKELEVQSVSGLETQNNIEESSPWDYPKPINSAQNTYSADELVIEHNSPPPMKNDPADQYIKSEETLSTSDYAFENENDSGVSAEVQENRFESFSDQTLNSNQYPQVEIKNEQNAPIQESYDQEEVFEISQFNEQTETQQPNLDKTENMPNSFNSQNPVSTNNQTVSNAPAPFVKNLVAQDPNPYMPQQQQVQTQQMPQTQQPQVIPQQPQNPAPQVQAPQVQATSPAYVEPPKTSAQVAPNPQAKAQLDALFHKMNEAGASDLHMSVSVTPMIRMDGKMVKLDESQPPITPDMMQQLLQSIMPQKNIEEFAERKDTDFAYEIKGLARFRANIFMDRKGMGGVFRIIPSDILTAEKLGLSKAIMDLCNLSKGLVVVTGPTGSGKSTTLCAMVDSINKQREDHIITIEDPIEFTHENQKCLVNQREVHNHTDSFKDALRAALREDPDILLVGEMRDLETISIAIETAETGHLVFGTLHTTTAASTIDRIIDQFPADRQQQVRVMLSESLRGVIAQTLLPKIGGGRIAALEVLIITPAISNLIREGKTFQIPSAMQTGKNKGMVMLNDALMELVNKGLVEAKEAYIKSVDKEGFEALLKRNGKQM